MIKNILTKGDVDSLNILFNTYFIANEEKEIFKTAGKLYLKSQDLTKERLIEITERVTYIINQHRDTYKNILIKIEELAFHGDFKQVGFLKYYLENFSYNSIHMINKLIDQMDESFVFSKSCKQIEIAIFLNLK